MTFGFVDRRSIQLSYGRGLGPGARRGDSRDLGGLGGFGLGGLVQPHVPVDRGGGDAVAVGVGELDLAGEDDLALGVEGGQGLVGWATPSLALASIGPLAIFS